MDFSLDWFTSIPGLLITGGVILLIIALIILIVTSGKKKKQKKQDEQASGNEPATTTQATQAMPNTANNNGAVPEMNSPAMTGGTIMDIPAPVATNPTSDMNMNNGMAMPTDTQAGVANVNAMDPMASATIQPTPVVNTPPIQEVPMAPSTPAVEPTTPEQVAPMAPPIEQPTPEPIAPIAPTVEQPTPEPITPMAPSVPTEQISPEQVASVATTPSQITPEPVASVAPTQATPQQPQGQPVIYGGANPIVPEINISEPQHQIYGGANPLENTQSIPISNLVGSQQSVVQTPTPEPTIVAQQPAPTPGQPTNPGQ
ncbi:MAG TPA: hypothetical protein IAB35_05930 [Candidatus Faecimonas gallistercoris]|nr:hypothetical protein [Candidatus Faecimonas gallistercoris]